MAIFIFKVPNPKFPSQRVRIMTSDRQNSERPKVLVLDLGHFYFCMPTYEASLLQNLYLVEFEPVNQK